MKKTIYIFVELELGPKPGTVWDLRFFATRKEAEDYGLEKANNAMTSAIIGPSEFSEEAASRLLQASSAGLSFLSPPR
jgi:hypothetical protein